MSLWRWIICVGLAGLALLTGDARACDYTSVRDAAFTEPRDVHWLCVVAKQNDAAADAIHRDLQGWLDQHGAGLNVEARRVAADDPDVAWEHDFGFPSAPTGETPLPAVVLVGRISVERRGFFIEAWQPPRPGPDDLAQLVSSPARDAIRTAAMQSIAVLVHFSGTDADAGAARKVIDTVVQHWQEKEKVGVSVVRVDRSDPRERVLRSFAGVGPSGPDRVAVVFGRGKFMRTPEGEPLEGERLTAERINEMIEVVMQECTCSTPPRSLGVDMPMIWNKALEEKVAWLHDGQEGGLVPEEVETTTNADSSRAAGRMVGMTIQTLAALALLVGLVAAGVVWGRYRGRTRG